MKQKEIINDLIYCLRCGRNFQGKASNLYAEINSNPSGKYGIIYHHNQVIAILKYFCGSLYIATFAYRHKYHFTTCLVNYINNKADKLYQYQLGYFDVAENVLEKLLIM